MNKIYFKKLLIKVSLIILIFTILFTGLINLSQNLIKQNTYNKMATIVTKIKEKYPLVTEKEIMDLLNSQEIDSNLFKKYGIMPNDILIKENTSVYITLMIISILLFLGASLSLVFIFSKYVNRQNKQLKKITNYLKAINKQNYNLELDSFSEDELSILKNEIYKTTIYLKEQSLNLKNDKLNLKKSLEDISHQLKTPLTSISLILDNLLDEETNKQKQEFLHDLKREANNLNFLVQNLLKLAQFDANTITLKKENINLKQLIKDVKLNVGALSDLKNIKITGKEEPNIVFKGDYFWEKEALTNILKNAIEYSNLNSNITINCSQNKSYTLVEIIDYGPPIKKEDLPHIFERFYSGNSKMIIEKDNGLIKVVSNYQETKFIIKYLKF